MNKATAIDLIERARALAPLIIREADEIERTRRLTEPVVTALIENGMYRALLPKSIGGAEVPLITFMQMQEEIAKKRVEATAGGGMVTVEANGKQEIVAIKIDPEVVNRDDVQMLEDLVLVACNEALRKSRELVQQELGKLTGGLKIPGLGM